MYILTPDDLIDMLYAPGTMVRLFLVWLSIVVVGVGIVLVATVPQAFSFFGARDDDAARAMPAWFTTFQQEQLVRGDARAVLDEQARAQRAGVPTGRMQAAATASFPTILPERIVIPAIGTDLPISNPTSTQTDVLDEELARAVVRYPDSGTVEDPTTNMLIFGHSSYLPVVRNALYKAFNDIQNLQHGDEVRIEANGRIYVYEVFRVYSASAQDDSILLNTGRHQLTLLTCDSFGKKSDRFIVEAEFVRSF